MVVVLYIFTYLLAFVLEQSGEKPKQYVLMASCTLLAVMAGFRNPNIWPDSLVYMESFQNYTKSLVEWSVSDRPFGYGEYGFYFLGVIFKTFSSSVLGYFIFIAVLSFLFLYKDFQRYCVYPLFGLCVYIARFYLSRNFIQIRAGLSYAIILWAVQYITNRDWRRYFFWILVAYYFHRSALVAVPLYFLCLLNPKKRILLFGIIGAFLLAGLGNRLVTAYIGDNATDLDIITYTSEDYQSEFGLRNPMIYFQLFFLWIYTWGEKTFQKLSKDYFTIRTAYWYSTCILISLSAYTALSGRTSSMFSTLEMAIIPMIVNVFSKKHKVFTYVGIGVTLTIIFYFNSVLLRK